MFMETCKECDNEFVNKKGLSYHIRTIHKMSYAEYLIKHEHNNAWPTCACGCGVRVRFLCGKFMDYTGGHYHIGKPKTEEHRKKISESNTGKVLTHEHREKIRQSVQAKHDHDPTLAQRSSIANKGKLFTHEHRQHMSETRSRKIASGEIVINRDAISQTVTQKYLDGGFEWSKGTYVSTKTGKTCYYRSSWELQYMQILDSDPVVFSWEYEFAYIPYELDGKLRRYLPDFHVTYADGHHELIEVKPESLRETPMNFAKRWAAQDYCSVNGWAYHEWKPE